MNNPKELDSETGHLHGIGERVDLSRFQPGDACMVSTFRLKRKDDGSLYNNRWSSEVLARARHSTLP